MECVEGQFTESLDEKLNKLKRKLEHLVSKEHDVMVELEYAEQLLMKKPRKEVENWLQEVGRTKTEVQDLEARVKEKSIFKHFTLGNSIDRCTAQVGQLIQRDVFSGGLTLEVCDSGVPLVTTELVGKKFQKNKKMIWERLMNNNVSPIGVYGMGGIGKTTLITHIHDQLLRHPISSVSWVTVSQNCRTFKLQDDIAIVLGLGPLVEKDERKRAEVLASALKKKKNFVLVLDDIWDYIKLDEVGIPANEIGCKLIITTRSLDVCRMMNCKDIIKVEPLSEKEAWELFQMHLGHYTRLPSHQIEEIAKSLVNEFAGLPLGIILAAGCLRGVDDICQWNDALEQMKSPSLEQDELEFGKVEQVLKYSFDKLNPTLQQCFLYCALYPEDYEIAREVLIQHFIDEKLIPEMNTRRAELNRGHTILNKLENSCLLEPIKRFRNVKYVKMHDVVRDMAIKIASRNSPRFVVGIEATNKLEDEREDERLMEATVRMSLLTSYFGRECTHISPRCPTLSTLLFFGLCPNSIPDCFFTHMNRLAVLDLSYSRIFELPTSVYNLQCLTSLVLRGCKHLSCLSSLENLKALRRLDVGHSGIIELPEGIDTLTEMRYLNLDCDIEVIPDGILCKLSHLQYLLLNRNCEISILRVEEIASLKRLETLFACFRDLNDFNACVNSWKDGGPIDYSLSVGSDCLFLSPVEGDDLDFGNTVYLSSGAKHSLVLPNHINSLTIEDIENLDVTTSFSDQRAFYLRHLAIMECGGIKHLLPCSCLSVPAFQSLESLHLHNLHDFSDLVEVERSASSALHTATFSYLKDVRIDSCCNIKRLFMPALLYNLQNVERLGVIDCYEMVEVVGPCDELDAQGASSSISSTLPNLTCLELSDLPELKFFCSNTKMDFPSLKDIKIEECPKLKRFPPLPPLPPSNEAVASTS